MDFLPYRRIKTALRSFKNKSNLSYMLPIILTLIFVSFSFTACSLKTSGQIEKTKAYESIPVIVADKKPSDESAAASVSHDSKESTEGDAAIPGESTAPMDGQNFEGTIWHKLGLIQNDPFEAYDSYTAFDDLVKPDDAPGLLMEGLSHSNPVVEWFSANKIIDYLDKINQAEAKNRLKTLTASEKEFVKEAASLALSVINKNWNSSGIMKSPKQNRYAFTRFRDSRASDGDVFIIENNQIKKYKLGFNIHLAGWSSDGNWLACYSGSRYGNELQFLDVKSGKEIYLNDGGFDSLKPVLAQLALKESRGFSDLALLQWSPDSKRVLLSYKYSDIDFNESGVILVNDFQRNSVDWATSLSGEELQNLRYANQSTGIPGIIEGFNWNANDYGLPGGLLQNLPLKALQDKAELAVKGLLKSISDNNLAEFKSFAGTSGKQSEEQIKAALKDFRTCFGYKPVSNFTYLGPGPEKINSFRYSVHNESRGGAILTLAMNEKGGFTCLHPCMEYSEAAHKLVKEYNRALNNEDIKALTRLLSHEKPVTEERVKKMVGIYKVDLDIKKLNIAFSGQVEGNIRKGLFYYAVKNNAGNDINGIHVNYENGKLTILDSWLEQIP